MKTRSSDRDKDKPDDDAAGSDDDHNPLALLLDACKESDALDAQRSPDDSPRGQKYAGYSGSHMPKRGKRAASPSQSGSASKKSRARKVAAPMRMEGVAGPSQATGSTSEVNTAAIKAAAEAAAWHETDNQAAARAAAAAAASVANANACAAPPVSPPPMPYLPPPHSALPDPSMQSLDAFINYHEPLLFDGSVMPLPSHYIPHSPAEPLPLPLQGSSAAAPPPSLKTSKAAKRAKAAVHTAPDDEERKHPCTQPGCPLMFIRLEHAKRHSEICGKSLHSTKQVPCPVCGTLFTREDNMKIHAKTKHQVEFAPKREKRLSDYS